MRRLARALSASSPACGDPGAGTFYKVSAAEVVGLYPAVVAARATLMRKEKVMHPLAGCLVRCISLSLKLDCISHCRRVLMRMPAMLW